MKKIKKNPIKMNKKNGIDVLKTLVQEKPAVQENGRVALEDITSTDVKAIQRDMDDAAKSKSIKKMLRTYLQNRFNDQEELAEKKKNHEAYRKRLTEFVSKFGVSVVSNPDEKILYEAPYKAHLLANRGAGGLNEELIQAKFPELFGNAEVLDLNQASLAAKKQGNTAVQLQIAAILEQVKLLERQSGLKILRTEAEGLLDMERYEEYKQSGRITPDMVKSFETEGSVHFTLKAVEVLVDKPNRCSACGDVKPKRKVQGHEAACKRCGHEE